MDVRDQNREAEEAYAKAYLTHDTCRQPRGAKSSFAAFLREEIVASMQTDFPPFDFKVTHP